MKQESETKVIGIVFLVMAGLFMMGATLFMAMDRTVMDEIAAAVCACGLVLSLGFGAHMRMADKRLRQSKLLELRLQQLGEHWKAGAR